LRLVTIDWALYIARLAYTDFAVFLARSAVVGPSDGSTRIVTVHLVSAGFHYRQSNHAVQVWINVHTSPDNPPQNGIVGAIMRQPVVKILSTH
jgi:hypothetical protein